MHEFCSQHVCCVFRHVFWCMGTAQGVSTTTSIWVFVFALICDFGFKQDCTFVQHGFWKTQLVDSSHWLYICLRPGGPRRQYHVPVRCLFSFFSHANQCLIDSLSRSLSYVRYVSSVLGWLCGILIIAAVIFWLALNAILISGFSRGRRTSKSR